MSERQAARQQVAEHRQRLCSDWTDYAVRRKEVVIQAHQRAGETLDLIFAATRRLSCLLLWLLLLLLFTFTAFITTFDGIFFFYDLLFEMFYTTW